MVYGHFPSSIPFIRLDLHSLLVQPKPLKNVSLKIDLETKRPLKSIYSPSHQVDIKRHGGNKASVGYEASDVKPDADFQLFFAQEPSTDLG